MNERCKRVVSVLLLCVVFCTTFVGCDNIDDLRTAKAILVDCDTVEWNGAAYKRVDELLTDKMDVFGCDPKRLVYVGEENVPSLLLPMFAVEYHPSEGDVFLRRDTFTDILWLPDGDDDRTDAYARYYCREDRYDDVMRQLLSDLAVTGYVYSYRNEYMTERGLYCLTADEKAAFDAVLTVNNSCAYPEMGEWVTTIYARTDDGLLDEIVYDVLRDQEVYYIARYNKASMYETPEDSRTQECYRVPAEYNDVFSVMLEKALCEMTHPEEVEVY